MITPEEAAAVTFTNRSDLMRFLLFLGAFGALVDVGRQPFWVLKSFPETYSFGAPLAMMPEQERNYCART